MGLPFWVLVLLIPTLMGSGAMALTKGSRRTPALLILGIGFIAYAAIATLLALRVGLDQVSGSVLR